MEWWQAFEGAREIGDVPDVVGLTHDSRLAAPGVAFAALPGRQGDGHDYIEAAIKAGASAVVVQADTESKWGRFAGVIPIVVVADTRAALGPMASVVHGEPSKRLRVIGVTGTDGKTTTSHLTSHVLEACGLGCGYLSSVGFDTGDGFELNTSHMTTLEATIIQPLLARAVAQGRRSMVVEASSEGLAQRRLDGCAFDVAVFTNLSRDHLDFHGTMEEYLAAKGILFQKLGEESGKAFAKAAVLNADDPNSAYLAGRTGATPISYGLGVDADVRGLQVEADGFGWRFKVAAGGEIAEAALPLIGRFNVYNSLAAIAVARNQGVALKDAAGSLAAFPGVPGRLERIEEGQAFRVFVDIASTASALENVLNALRPATRGRLWVVFGAAGGRDVVRREGMGLVAARLADRAVLTNEDPRAEDPEAIIAAIASAMTEAGRVEGADFVRIADRREAIRHAFEQAHPGDTVLLAGKATETTMLIGPEQVAWDERAVARELLRGPAHST
ncbi:MAG: UDP-N-acetylmuramoyl-L-alanyl-D-glutamate--2,6-diaminopimelate ligase [Dehalococcoidia bacterium]|nr:UDP-N-acetylmuramoyl-L-alanyl-D-glutamate--2,6-diaminopimelate ligase [Dehalococcoidia bacterium]